MLRANEAIVGAYAATDREQPEAKQGERQKPVLTKHRPKNSRCLTKFRFMTWIMTSVETHSRRHCCKILRCSSVTAGFANKLAINVNPSCCALDNVALPAFMVNEPSCQR